MKIDTLGNTFGNAVVSGCSYGFPMWKIGYTESWMLYAVFHASVISIK